MSKDWIDLIVEYGGKKLEEKRVDRANTIAASGGVKALRMGPAAVSGFVSGYTVRLGEEPGDTGVFTATCSCGARKLNAVMCEHIIALAGVAVNNGQPASFESVGADPASYWPTSPRAYPGVSQSEIIWSALAMLERLTIDARASVPLASIIAKCDFDSLEDAVTAAITIADWVSITDLQVAIPFHERRVRDAAHRAGPASPDLCISI